MSKWDGRSSKPLDLGNVATATSPHTISAQSWYRSGAVVTAMVQITLGASLGSGDIPNTTVATITTPLPVTTTGAVLGPDGPVLTGVLTDAGLLRVTATTGTVASGTAVSLYVTYLTAE